MIQRLLCALGLHHEIYQVVDEDEYAVLRLRCASCDWHSKGLATPISKRRTS